LLFHRKLCVEKHSITLIDMAGPDPPKPSPNSARQLTARSSIMFHEGMSDVSTSVMGFNAVVSALSDPKSESKADIK
jgi:hypothetical protein